jgi:hypothetical protein
MRLTSFFYGSIALIILSCNKSSTALHTYPGALTGKWRFTEYYISPGGPGSWYPATPAGQWFNLNTNGTITSNMEEFKQATAYELPDSSTIKMLLPARPGGFKRYHYSIDTLQQVLVLSPLDPMCIEGCALKFKRW